MQSRVFCVGNGVIAAEAGVGAVATQSMADIGYGPQALALLEAGHGPCRRGEKSLGRRSRSATAELVEARPAIRGDQHERRSRGVHRREGSPWAGHKIGKNCTAQGNILAGEEVVNGMVDGFEKTEGHLAYRLLAALEVGQMAGGDKRGMQSANMIIVKKNGGPWLHNDTVLRLQVDDNEEPIKELRRLVEKSGVRKRVPRQPPATDAK